MYSDLYNSALSHEKFIEIGYRLYDERKKHGYSQEKLAEMVYVSRGAVSAWERGQYLPSTDKLLMLCELYDCDMDYLMGRIDESKHDLKFICEQTGLNEAAAKRLQAAQEKKRISEENNGLVPLINDPQDFRKMNRLFNSLPKETGKILSMIISNKNFGKLVNNIGRLIEYTPEEMTGDEIIKKLRKKLEGNKNEIVFDSQYDIKDVLEFQVSHVFMNIIQDLDK